MRRLLIPVLFLALGAGAFLGLRATRPEPAEVAPQERSWRVETLSVALSSHAPLLPLYGEIVAPEAVTFTAPLPARIAERPVRDGQRVAEGEPLVVLDEADVAPVVARAEARVADLAAQIEAERVRQQSDRTALARERELLDNAGRRLARVRSLSDRNLASASSLDDARDALAQARVTVDAREGALAGHPARLAQAAWPSMRENGWGRIVNVASIHAQVASPGKAAYISAKHGLIGLTKTAALEGGPQGITANALCPAYVKTPLVENQIADQARLNQMDEQEVVEQIMLKNAAVKRLIDPGEVASLVGYLASDAAGAVTGASWNIDLGWTAQ
ncbi:SDR family oxidoreductase [Halomonas sp. B23F22_10]|uniref:SDR family oxidoreductase n=1 Tax=Halomonas sp. B23F22_10 TaxID=3459515 RepID=UPI00373E84C1